MAVVSLSSEVSTQRNTARPITLSSTLVCLVMSPSAVEDRTNATTISVRYLDHAWGLSLTFTVHLTDLGSDVAPDNARQSPYSNVPQPFHADTADIIALYTLSTPKSGGRSLLASSGKIYNEIASQYPKHIVELAKNNWAYDTFGRQSAYNIRPLLHSLPGASPLPVLLSFSRRPLTGSPVSTRTEGIPSLTIEQSDALDTVHFTAAAHSIAITQQPGDMQYWNNFALLHAREGFEDCAETGQRRHLMRLWLRDDDKATMCGTDVIPDALKGYWEDAFAEKESEVQGWPTEPIAEKKFVCEQRRSCGHA